VNSFGRFEGTAILRNVGTLCNITEDSNFRNLNNKCICKLKRFFRHVKGFETLSLGWKYCETRSVNLKQQRPRIPKTSYCDMNTLIILFVFVDCTSQELTQGGMGGGGSLDKAPQIEILKTQILWARLH
jgi:hypothetical protein